jgi:glutamate racemase
MMRILFDQGTPVPLRKALSEHSIATAYECGWSALKNGELLQSAEDGGFEILITTDMNLRYQQNLASRKIAVIVLSTTSWPRIQRVITQITEAINQASIGSYCEIDIPYRNQ